MKSNRKKFALIIVLMIAVVVAAYGVIVAYRSVGPAGTGSAEITSDAADGSGAPGDEEAGSDGADGAGKPGGEKAGAGSDGADGDGKPGGEKAGAGSDDAGESGPLATVFFASDYQAESGFDEPAETLKGILSSAEEGGKRIDRVVMCGDYTNDAVLHDYQLSPDESIDEIREIVREECPEIGGDGAGGKEGEGTKDQGEDEEGGSHFDVEGGGAGGKEGEGAKGQEADIAEEKKVDTENSTDSTGTDEKLKDTVFFVQGNHDRMTEEITETGLHDCGDYLIYVLNTEEDFPWKQGKTSGCLAKVKQSSAEMDECFDGLIGKGETRPVFIAGHVPLHFTARTSPRHTTGDNLYSSLIYNVVNDAAKELDIVYLFGHNHSKGWDCYMGGGCVFKAVGDTLLLPKFDESRVNTDEYTEETLNFTYMNAGYTGYYMNCGPAELSAGAASEYSAADETLTGTVIEVYADRLEISRWDVNGEHGLGSEGEADPYKGGIDEGLIPGSAYSHGISSPQRIKRK